MSECRLGIRQQAVLAYLQRFGAVRSGEVAETVLCSHQEAWASEILNSLETRGLIDADNRPTETGMGMDCGGPHRWELDLQQRERWREAMSGPNKMWQDAEGTIPVTQSGDPVGRRMERDAEGERIKAALAAGHAAAMELKAAAALTLSDSEQRCANCRFCEPHAHYEPRGFMCNRASSSDGEPVEQGSLAVAHDGESCSAWLDVELAFGCVQWERDG